MNLLRLIVFYLLFSNVLISQTYNYYYGNIHAHTAYSDGNSENNVAYDCPTESYQYAKVSQNFNFLGISEHNHFGAGMTVKTKYTDGINEANLENQDGTFVCMYGMEWGVISGGGHVIIYGVNELIGWDAGLYDIYNAKFDYDGLFTKVARYPGGNAFAYLAHPDTSDYGNLLRSPRNSTYDSAIVGAAIRSGPAFSTVTTYTNPSTSSYLIRYREALSLGYRLGAGLDHDNHYTTFGRTAQSRLVVMAPSLTRANIMDGIKKMRMYSSDDWNIKVNFRINTQPLGSDFSAMGNPTISVTVSDDDAESVSNIRIYYGIPGSGVLSTLLASNTNSTALNYTHTVVNGSSYYYYVQVIQPDGDDVYTSPIWFSRNDVVLPIELLSFNAKQSGDEINLEWETSSEINNDYFVVESSLNGFDFDPVGNMVGAGNSTSTIHYQLNDTTTPAKVDEGIIYYRLKQIDYDKSSKYSNIISLNYKTHNLISSVTVFPVPASSIINISLNSKKDETIVLTLYDVMGEILHNSNQLIIEGINKISFPLPHLKNGVYFLAGNCTNSPNLFNKLVIINNP